MAGIKEGPGRTGTDHELSSSLPSVDLPPTLDRVKFRTTCEQLFGENRDFDASALDAFVESVIAFIGGEQVVAR